MFHTNNLFKDVKMQSIIFNWNTQWKIRCPQMRKLSHLESVTKLWMRFLPISVTSLWTLATTLESYDSDKILTLSFKSFGIHICGQHMHSSLPSMGRVVHVCFQSSSIPKAIPWKKIMVKFGFFEVQSGFKSCTGYFYKRKKKKCQQDSSNKSWK